MVASAGHRANRVPALAKYEVLEELGHGGMATVYRAHDKRLARDVAVKVLHPHLRESTEIAHRFTIEAKAVAKLRHPNIVEVFDVSSEDEEEQYLVVELVRGLTLRKLLQKYGPLPPEIGAAIASEVLGALAHAHASGVVHRDVKPENVLLEQRSTDAQSGNSPSTPSSDVTRGERVTVKLTDFGIAKLLDAQGVTSTGQVLGSPAHMAPEQIEGGEVDARADVFGLGVLMYECVVGHLPFEGNNPAQVLRRVLDGIYPNAEREKSTVGKAWSDMLDIALSRSAEDRYADASAMREALLTELSRLGISSPRSALEAYFHAPEAWTKDYEEHIATKLCDLGAELRKRGDAVAAAADYNRALAYSPNDPQLLRIVSGMHRAEARWRFIRRGGPLLFGVIALGASAFFVARALKESSLISRLPPSASASVSLPSATPRPSALPPASSGATPDVPIVPPKPSAVVSGGGAASTAKTTTRTVTLSTLRPPFGVHMTIDGQASPTEPAQGAGFSLDDRAHVLRFGCEKDMCEPSVVQIAAGTKDESVSVELKILPAKLVVDGDPGHSYGIEEVPNVTLGAGVATEVPMRAGRQTVHVFDRSDPTQRKVVSIRAGQRDVVSFKAQ